MQRTQQDVTGLIKSQQRRKRWQQIVSTLVCIVVFCTTYALILPAITMSDGTYCGLEEHTHSQTCYSEAEIHLCYNCLSDLHSHTEDCCDENGAVICSVADFVLHQHNDYCYDTNGLLCCSLSEYSGHTHTSDCYDADGITLICDQVELKEHTHTDDCYSDGVLSCGFLEVIAHQHTQECLYIESVQPELVCALQEHTHSLQCYADPSADLENAAIWELTLQDLSLTGNWAADLRMVAISQLGYAESEENYIVLEDGETCMGYTRYGQWAGDPYGEWNQFFLEFCLYYAGVGDAFPRAQTGERWFDVLDAAGWTEYCGYVPNVGELIFVNIDGVEQVGVVTAVDSENNITAIYGDWEGCVAAYTVSANDASIAGYALMPGSEDVEILDDTDTSGLDLALYDSTGIAGNLETYIDSITVTVNGTEVGGNDIAISYSDTIRFFVEYSIDVSVLSSTANTVTYKIPETVSLFGTSGNEISVGNVLDSAGNTVGKYVYYDGVLYIVFDNEYVEKNQAGQEISGTITLEATGWSFSSTEETEIAFSDGQKVTLYFPDDETSSGASTLDVSKSASIVGTDSNGNAIVQYTVTIYSAAGTGGSISLVDALSTDQSYLIDTDHPVTIVSTNIETTESGTTTSTTTTTATSVDQTLAQLDAGEYYRITYYATLPIGPDGTISGENTVTGETMDTSGNGITDSSMVTVRDTLLDKTGWADTTNNRIWWTVYVGTPGQSLAGWKLSDTLGTAAQNITVMYYTDTSGQSTTTVNPADGSLGEYTFPEESYGEAKITYYTEYTSTQLGYNSVTNSVTLTDSDNKEYNTSEQVWTENYNPASKSFEGYESAIPDANGNVTVKWTYTLNTSEGPLLATQTDENGTYWILKDSLYNGYFTEDQYNAVVTEITAKLDAALSHTHGGDCYSTDAVCGLTEHTHSDRCYSCDTEGHEHTEDCLTCELSEHTHSEANGECYLTCTRQEVQYHTHTSACVDNCSKTENTVLSFTEQTTTDSSGNTRIVGFSIKVYSDLPQGLNITFDYSSTLNVGDDSSYVSFGNNAYINDSNGVSASATYTPTLRKVDGKSGSSSDTTYAQMDLTDTDGNVNVSWKVQVCLKEAVSSDVTILEKLPAEVDLSNVILTLPGGQTITLNADSNATVTYNGVEYTVSVSAVTVTNEDETTTTTNDFTIQIPKALANALQEQVITLQINTTIKEDKILDIDSSGSDTISTLTLPNTVTISYKDASEDATEKALSDSQTQTLTSKNTTDLITKTSTADNNSNEITYTIEVNPEAADLNPNGDYLTVEDLMQYWTSTANPIDSRLMSGSVRLYIETLVTGTATDAIALDDLTVDGWFSDVLDTVTVNGDKQQIKVTTDGVSISFNSKTSEDAGSGDYRFVPTAVLYSGTDGYSSADAIWYHRGDNYGWSSTIKDADGYTPDTYSYTAAKLYSTYGISYTSIFDSNVFPGWDALVELLQSGVECTVTAITKAEPTTDKENAGYVTLTIDMAGICNSVQIPVDDITDVYLALSGEQVELTDIEYSDSIESYLEWQLVSDFSYVYSQEIATVTWASNGYYVNNELEFVVPDGVHLVLQYTYTFTGDLGSWVSISNTAKLSGSDEAVDKDGVSVQLNNAVTAYVNLSVFKVDADDAELGLEGAVFDLYKWHQEYTTDEDGNTVPKKDEDGNLVGEWKWDQTTTSTSNGNLSVTDLDENQAYYLVEIVAPKGYILDQSRHYFLLKNSYKDEVIAPSDFPVSAYRPKGSVLTISNVKADMEIAVDKIWQDENGNQTNPPAGGEVQLQLMQVLHAFGDDFDYDSVLKLTCTESDHTHTTECYGEYADIDLYFGQYSYEDYDGKPLEIKAKVGSYVLIQATVPNAKDAEGNLLEAGLMENDESANYSLRYTRTDNGNDTSTYIFRYLVEDASDVTLRGWTFLEDATNVTVKVLGTYEYAPVTLSVGSGDSDTKYLDAIKLDSFETGKLTFAITVPEAASGGYPLIYINGAAMEAGMSTVNNTDGTVTYKYTYTVPDNTVEQIGSSIHFAIGNYDPNSVTIEVEDYISAYGDSVTLNRNTGWTKEYTDIPAYLLDEKTGKIIGYYSYYVVETGVNENYVTDYYTVSENYLLVYNRYLPTRSISVQKEWADGTTKSPVNVQLYQIAGNMPIYSGMGEDATVNVGIKFKNGYLDLKTCGVSDSAFSLACTTGTTITIQMTSKWNAEQHGSWYVDPTFEASDGSDCTVTAVINSDGSTTYLLSYYVADSVSLSSVIDYELTTETVAGVFTIDNIYVNIPTIYTNTIYNGIVQLDSDEGWHYEWTDLPSVGIDQNGSAVYYTYSVKEISDANASADYTVYYSEDGIHYDTYSPAVTNGKLYILNTLNGGTAKVSKQWVGPDELGAVTASDSIKFNLYKWTQAQESGTTDEKYKVSATYNNAISASGDYTAGTVLYIDVIAGNNAQYWLWVGYYGTDGSAVTLSLDGTRKPIALDDGTVAYVYTYKYVVAEGEAAFQVKSNDTVYNILLRTDMIEETPPDINGENWTQVDADTSDTDIDSYEITSAEDWDRILSKLDSTAYYKLVEVDSSAVTYYVNGIKSEVSAAIFKPQSGVITIDLVNTISQTQLTVNKVWPSGSEKLSSVTMDLYRLKSQNGLNVLLADDYVDCTMWWENYFSPLSVTEEGLTIKFTAQANSFEQKTYYCPSWVLYSSADGMLDNDTDSSYIEYWVQRADNYGWATSGEEGEDDGYFAIGLNRYSGDALLNKYGIYQSYSDGEYLDSDGTWSLALETAFTEAMLNGVEVTVRAQLVNDDVVVTMSLPVTITKDDGTTVDFTVSSTMTIPVDTSKPIFLGLSGEKVELTNIFAVSGVNSDFTVEHHVSEGSTDEEVILSESNNWTHTWTELPLSETDTDDKTVYYTYYALENTDGLSEYNTTYALSEDGSVLTVSNDSSTEIFVEKVWLDEDGNVLTGSAIPNENVTVQLYQHQTSDPATELDCTGWWRSFTDGIELTTEGVYITFNNTTYDTATGNWQGPLVHLYNCTDLADCTFVTGKAGYSEIWTQRCDNYGWSGNAGYFDVTEDSTNGWLNTNNLTLMETAGISVSSVQAPGCWDNFLENMQDGCSGTVIAWLEQTDGKWYAVFSIDFNGVCTTVRLPVQDDDGDSSTAPRGIYLSLTGELTMLTDIVVTSGKTREYGNDVKIGEYTLNSSNDWYKLISGLPTYGYDNGSKVYYSYYFKEVEISGWITDYNYTAPTTGGEVTVSNSPANKITVNKVWKDADGNTIDPPTGKTVTIQLMQIANLDYPDTSMAFSDSYTTLSDVDNTSGFNVNQSSGVEITESGVEFTFKSISVASAASNWHGPIFHIYSGTDSTIDSYYWTQRGDAYGWGTDGTWTSSASDGAWTDLVSALKAGVDVKVAAYLEGEYVQASITISWTDSDGVTQNIHSAVTAKVDTSKPVYLCVSGELCTLTEIQVRNGKVRADGTAYRDSVVLNADNGWTYTFDDLPEYARIDGSWVYYTYYVVETSIPGYKTTYSTTHPMTDGAITITNTPTETTSITVQKVWSGTNKTSVIMQLWQVFTPLSSEDTESHTHTYTGVTTTATCTERGSTTWSCSCGKTYTVYTSALGHNYGEWTVVNATCEESGSQTRICSTCDQKEIVTIEATGHSWDDGVVTKAATETESGIRTYTYKNDSLHTYTETIPATGHTHTYTASVTAPTCTEQGYTTYSCSCGHSYTADTVGATGHSYETVVTDPTCITSGYTTYTCTICGDSYVSDYTSATGHSYESDVTAPTCTSSGYTAYTCKTCGSAYIGEYTDPTGHTWDEGKVTTEATQSEPGIITYTCTVCGETRIEEYELGNTHTHSYTSSVTTEATCTTPGVRTYVCSCGYSYAEEIGAINHTYTQAIIENEQPATANEPGSYDVRVLCDLCNHQFYYETGLVIPAGVSEYYTAFLVLNQGAYMDAVVLTGPGSYDFEIASQDWIYESVIWIYPAASLLSNNTTYSASVALEITYDSSKTTVIEQGTNCEIYSRWGSKGNVYVETGSAVLQLTATWDGYLVKDVQSPGVWNVNLTLSGPEFPGNAAASTDSEEESAQNYALNAMQLLLYAAVLDDEVAQVSDDGETATGENSGAMYGDPITITSADNWTYTWENLPVYAYDVEGNIVGTYTYYVVEENGDIYNATYSNDGPVSGGTITVTNTANDGYELPASGSVGTRGYTITGVALMLGAAVVLMYSKKKGRREARTP